MINREPGPVYRAMAKLGDGWDNLVKKGAGFTTKHGTKLSVIFLILTLITSVIARKYLPDTFFLEMGFEGKGSTYTRESYIMRMTLLSIMSNSIFMFLSKRTLWLVTSFSCILAFSMVVFSNIL